MDDVTTHSFSFVGMKRQVKDGKVLTVVYSDSYRREATSERYVDFSGEYTVADRRTVVFCKNDQQGNINLSALRMISKDNHYLHLLKSIKVLERYGSSIGSICTNLLNNDAEF